MEETGVVKVAGEITQEDIIFSALFKTDEEVNARRSALFTAIPDASVFTNEYYIFYTMLKNAPKIKITERYLTLFLKSNKALLMKSNNVNLAQFTFGDNDAFMTFGESCVKKFLSCVSLKVDLSDYETALAEVKMNYIQMQTLTILEESAIIMRDGKKQGHKTLVGYDDMRSNLNLKFTQLDTLFKTDGSRGFIIYDGAEEVEEEALKEIGKYGIKGLDDAGLSIMEGDMISLVAPSKGGKSKFCVGIQHSMVVQGVNIVSWSIENGYKGWEAMMRARHFTYTYNKTAADATQKIWINSEDIRQKKLQGKTKELEAASWLDLKTNSNYGKMLCIDEPFQLDTFLDILEKAVDTIHAKFVCIDYLQLIEGERGMSKSEAISKAYIRTLQFLKRKKIAGIFPAQLKQDVVNELSKVKPEDLGKTELRTGAGESYEVFKTPDVNFCLYGTMADMEAHTMKLLLLPSRNIKPLPPLDLAVDFSTCSFISIDKMGKAI